MQSPAFRGQIIPHLHDTEVCELGNVTREVNGKKEYIGYISDTHVKHIKDGEEYLYCCPTNIENAVTRGPGFGFTYFRFFPDGSSECRDADGQLWKFSPTVNGNGLNGTCVCEECQPPVKKCSCCNHCEKCEQPYHWCTCKEECAVCKCSYSPCACTLTCDGCNMPQIDCSCPIMCHGCGVPESECDCCRSCGEEERFCTCRQWRGRRYDSDYY